MKTDDARALLEALANGFDPETGKPFPEDSPLNNPHIIRALFLGAKALQEAPRTAERPKRVVEEGLKHAGKPWTEAEEKLLAAAFQRGDSVDAIAEAHNRKPGGISSRLTKLGLVKAE